MVRPSSAPRATGRPAITTPVRPRPFVRPIENLWPMGGSLWRGCSATKRRASASVSGTSSLTPHPRPSVGGRGGGSGSSPPLHEPLHGRQRHVVIVGHGLGVVAGPHVLHDGISK